MVCLLPTLFRQRQSAAGGTSVQADNIVGPGDMRAQLEQIFKNSNVSVLPVLRCAHALLRGSQ
jgi:hypothetical protein